MKKFCLWSHYNCLADELRWAAILFIWNLIYQRQRIHWLINLSWPYWQNSPFMFTTHYSSNHSKQKCSCIYSYYNCHLPPPNTIHWSHLTLHTPTSPPFFFHKTAPQSSNCLPLSTFLTNIFIGENWFIYILSIQNQIRPKFYPETLNLALNTWLPC